MGTRNATRGTILLTTAVAALAACQAADVDGPAVDRDGTLVDGSVIGSYVARAALRHDGTSAISHHLVLDDTDLELTVPEDLAAPGGPAFERGTTLRVWGEPQGERHLEVASWSIEAPAPAPLIDADPFDPRVIATILLFWESPGLNNGNAEQYMFAGPEATSVFYGEVSYGRERMIGEVFGPYQIPDPGFCDPYAIGVAARAAMLDKGHNPADYQQLMYHFPSAGCDFAGLADVGAPQFAARDSWYHDSFGCVVRAQELGHNYGMGHSHAYNCGDDVDGNPIVLADNCAHIEYGDPYDPMGLGCGHINAVQKTYMGWLDGCNVVDVTADGTFNLMPIETPCDGTQALRVPAFDGRAYWLEYRQPIGAFDDSLGVDGVIVHIAAPFDGGGGFGPRPYYLDINGNGLLLAGDTFTDPDGVVSFTVVEQNPTHAVVEVTFPDGGTGAPSCRGGGSPTDDAGAIGSRVCAAGPYPADDTPPEVTITYPADGDRFDPGASFTITAEASDDRILSDLELYLDGSPVQRLFDEPWQWEVTNIPAGEYEFGVVARDGRNMGLSQAVTIVVGGDPVPDTTGGADDTTGAPPASTGGDASSSGDPDAAPQVGDGGCGCRAARRHGAAPWWLGALVGLARRRRPRTIATRRRATPLTVP